jgi:D-alanyl-D-alanine carboxypeptidase
MMASNLQQKIRTTLAALGVDANLIEQRGLPLFEDATNLMVVERSKDGKEHLLESLAASEWLELEKAATEDGISVFIVSAYRGFQRQTEVVRSAIASGRSVESVFANIAPPGCSEHHTGRAVDLGTTGCDDLTEAFEQTAAFDWLQRRAAQFGFRLSFPRNNEWGYTYEPWHWCFDPSTVPT